MSLVDIFIRFALVVGQRSSEDFNQQTAEGPYILTRVQVRGFCEELQRLSPFKRRPLALGIKSTQLFRKALPPAVTSGGM